MADLKHNLSEMLQKLQDDMKRIVKGVSAIDLTAFARGEWSPLADVMEGPAEIRVRVDLPGVSPQALDVNLSGRILKIEGERPPVPEGEAFTAHLAERNTGRFQRSFTLPAEVDPDQISATFQEGVLDVVLPKKTPEKGSEIKIEVV